MQKSSKIKNRIFPAFDDIKSQDEFPYFFDQKNIFNPRKKVGATLDDIRKYIAHPHPNIPHSS